MKPIPLPSAAQTHVILDTVLKPSGYKASGDVTLTWDTREPPSLARMGRSKQIPLETWDRPVVSPKAAAMLVRSELLPFCIDIPCGQYGFVTIHDLLERLYQNLQKPLLEEERAMLMKKNPEGWKSIFEAFELRCEMSPNRLLETRCGVKRVDILRSASIFAGFEPDPNDPSTLWLKFMADSK